MNELERVLADVTLERKRQLVKWDGITDDNTHTPDDWHTLLSDYNGWARRMFAMGSLKKAHRRYVQIAAIAVAAAEAIGRKLGIHHPVNKGESLRMLTDIELIARLRDEELQMHMARIEQLESFIRWLAKQHYANGLSKAMIIEKAQRVLDWNKS